MWEDFGITDPQAEVYEWLVHRPQSDIAALVIDLSWPRARVSRTLQELVSHGMVTRSSGRPSRFTAVPPEQVAGTLITQREQRISQLRTHAQGLGEIYRKMQVRWEHPSELVELIEGAANVAGAFARLQRQAEREVRGFDRPPYVGDPARGNPDQVHQQEQGVAYRVVYDRAGLALPGRMGEIWKAIHHGAQARVGDVPMKMVLCDDKAALIPAASSGGHAAYLIHTSTLLDVVIALFESTWERAVAVNRLGASEGDRELMGADLQLLGLLAAGATDESIARNLGWSVRTVRRHVHRLMVDLGAETRFQLGMEASRKGWL